MPLNFDQSRDNIQRLVFSCERRIGLTRLTENTIKDGPDELMKKCFNYLITDYVDNFSIYDTLDSMFRTATMIISDPVNWRTIAPFTGHEIITIAYKNGLTNSDTKEKIIHFRVSNIREEQNTTTLSSGHKRLIVNLVEFPAFHFLTSNQYYKSYPVDENNTPNIKISDIIKDMLQNIKYFNLWYDIEIEETLKDNISVFIPNWIPMKVVNFCKKYAISEKDKYPNYTFHIGNTGTKDKPIIYFKPIFSFIDDRNKFRPYGLTFQDINKEDTFNTKQITYSPIDTIHAYSFQYFDAKATNYFSGNTDFIFDYSEDNEYICTDYKKYLEREYKGINKFVIYPISYGNQWSTFNRSGWHKKEGEMLIKGELYNEYANNILLNGIYCEAMSCVFEGRNTGERAEIIFNINDANKTYDEMFSGAWLTWSVEDHFSLGKCFSSIKFINDSFVKITDPSNTFKSINTITSNREPIDIKA